MILHKTKLYRLKKLNHSNFYEQQCKNLGKLKYDGEIQKDIKRTYADVAEFSSVANQEKLRRALNLLCIQNPSRVGYVQGMNFVCATFLMSVALNEEASFWGLV